LPRQFREVGHHAIAVGTVTPGANRRLGLPRFRITGRLSLARKSNGNDKSSYNFSHVRPTSLSSVSPALPKDPTFTCRRQPTTAASYCRTSRSGSLFKRAVNGPKHNKKTIRARTFVDLKSIFGFKIKMRGILYINPRKRESWGGPCKIFASAVMIQARMQRTKTHQKDEQGPHVRRA